MKKVLFTIAAAVMMFAATSCKKENVNEPENFNREPEAYEFLATVNGGATTQNAPRVNDGMGTLATFDPETLTQVMWQVGDVIKVNGIPFTCTTNPGKGENFDNRAYFENNDYKTSGYHAPEYHAFYSTSVSNTSGNGGTLSATQYYNPENQAENLPMYAYSTDHWLNFSNICAAIKIYVPCTADHIVISNTSAPLHGNFTINESNVAVMESTTGDEYKKITIRKKIKTPQVDDDFHACDSLFIAIPAGTYAGFEIAFYENAEDENPIYTTGPTASGKNLTVTANKIYRIVGYNYNKDQYLLPGKFKVSDNNNEYVRFTAGNLWKDNLGGYHFEANQNGYQYNPNHVGHFNDLVDTIVGGVQYNAWTHTEFTHLLGLQGTPAGDKYDWDCTSDLVSCAKVDDIWCLLVAPFGATAFDKTRDKYTLKEVNSMGLLCLPFAGNLADVPGKGKIVVFHSDAPKAEDGGTIMARYWASDFYTGTNNFRWILCFDNKPKYGTSDDYSTLETNEITRTTYQVPEAYGRSIRLMMRYPQE